MPPFLFKKRRCYDGTKDHEVNVDIITSLFVAGDWEFVAYILTL